MGSLWQKGELIVFFINNWLEDWLHQSLKCLQKTSAVNVLHSNVFFWPDVCTPLILDYSICQFSLKHFYQCLTWIRIWIFLIHDRNKSMSHNLMNLIDKTPLSSCRYCVLKHSSRKLCLRHNMRRTGSGSVRSTSTWKMIPFRWWSQSTRTVASLKVCLITQEMSFSSNESVRIQDFNWPDDPLHKPNRQCASLTYSE